MTVEYEEALAWLYNQKKLQKKEDLSRIKRCIELLHIKTNYKILHIAGTNGKGSTASFLNQMMLLKGKKVGLFVSPYVISFNERIQVNGIYIADDEVLFYIQELKIFALEYFQSYHDTIPFFELTFLMALLYFQKQGIEVLILECGLGGLLDVTNAIDKDVAIITNIGYDHQAQLGNSLEEIATHKLGITRPDIPCFTTVDEELVPYFKKYALKNSIPMHFVKQFVSNVEVKEGKTHFTYQEKKFHTSLIGLHQAYNASLAIEIIRYFFHDYSDELIQAALDQAFWPGRLEKVKDNIILDGAHNIHGVKAICESLKKIYPDKKIKIVFTALKDKAIHEMLGLLDEIASFYYFTTIVDKRASNAIDFVAYTKKPYQIILEYKKAIALAVTDLKDEEVLVITGSLHFISEARKLLLEEILK